MRTGRNNDVEPGRTSCASRVVVSVCPEDGLDPVGGETRPPFVGVGHRRDNSNRVRVVAVAARICCSCLTLFRPRRASKKTSWGKTNGARHGGAEWERAQIMAKATEVNSHPCSSLD